jgi:FkbM family methyltransferase
LLNDRKFSVFQRAVFDKPDVKLSLATHSHRHTRNSVVDKRSTGKEEEYNTEVVNSTTIDNLIAQIENWKKCNVVIKLDVEGAELQALKGAQETIKHDNLIILYEELFSNISHDATDYLLKNNFILFTIGHRNLTPIHSTTEIASYKARSENKNGCNLLAITPCSKFLKLFNTMDHDGIII